MFLSYILSATLIPHLFLSYRPPATLSSIPHLFLLCYIPPSTLSSVLRVFLMHMSIILAYVMSRVRPVDRPVVLYWALNISLSTNISRTCHAYRHHWFLQLYTTRLPGVARCAQNKTSWLHFCAHFSTDQDEN